MAIIFLSPILLHRGPGCKGPPLVDISGFAVTDLASSCKLFAVYPGVIGARQLGIFTQSAITEILMQGGGEGTEVIDQAGDGARDSRPLHYPKLDNLAVHDHGFQKRVSQGRVIDPAGLFLQEGVGGLEDRWGAGVAISL